MATHSSTLAWRIPWMEEPGRLQFMGPQRVRHLSDFTSLWTRHFVKMLQIFLSVVVFELYLFISKRKKCTYIE